MISGPRKFRVLSPDGHQLIWQPRTPDELTASLGRWGCDIVHKDSPNEALGFDDIQPESAYDFRPDTGSSVKYHLQSTFFRKEIASASTKTQSLTEAQEAEFGSFMENSLPTSRAVSVGYNRTHRFQLWIQHKDWPNPKERDGLFFFPEEGMVLLVSCKIRFGKDELLELLGDLTIGKMVFHVNDWTIMSKSGEMISLQELYPAVLMPHTFPTFAGLAVSPLFAPDLAPVDSVLFFERSPQHSVFVPNGTTLSPQNRLVLDTLRMTRK